MRSDFSAIFLARGIDLAQAAGKLVLILLLVTAAKRLINLSVERLISRRTGSRLVDERRVRTLGPLITSIFTYVLYFVGLVSALEVFGVKTTSLIATAGLASLAVGFGAQNLVKDVITGFFILMEDQFGVGDRVTIAGFTGIVEEMGIRTTRLRGDEGQLHVIPNGQIAQVTNYMGKQMRVAVTATFPRSMVVDKALAIMEKVADEISEAPGVTSRPAVVGVTRLSDATFDVEVRGGATPYERERLENELKARVKRALEEEGI